MAAKRKPTLEDELGELRAVVDEPRAADAPARLKKGLASARALVVAKAAGLVRDRRLDGYAAELRAAWTRFLDDGPKKDPGCRAKLAVVEALDFTETLDEAPFLAAARYVQQEPAWGQPEETAGGVRARALLALARIHCADLPLVAGEALADPQAQVRAAAADALAAYGERACASTLLLKLTRPDDDPLVALACMSALLALAPDYGLDHLRPLLSARGERRELAALALGQTSRDDAAEALIAALRACVTPADREVCFRALGLHRSEKAAAVLLEAVATASRQDAAAALRALATRRFEPGMRARAEAAAARNEDVDLRPVLAEAFKD